MAAFDVFASINDEDDLVDTLKRIARHYGGDDDEEDDAGGAGQQEAGVITEVVEELLLKIVAGACERFCLHHTAQHNIQTDRLMLTHLL